ncbi:ferrous iron transport protein A [Oculatella sp. LEGE 06141]|uniref:FeoA family protein n=1 Tax=Oculatella sp. LEGE 06141 TaxID=1828648 RepID=UPI00187F2DB7|nr:FeoA family protein [Oculatella sp. LEGE 06141]MBE9182782.1 ferrous iron transport protein A [Oculatella sp. LEGE 06141]
MFNQRGLGSGSLLKLLKIGERGVVSRLGRVDDRIVQKLRAMGITLGTSITVEQQFPRFLVKVGCDRFAMSEELVRAIYVHVASNEIKPHGIRSK